MKLTKHFKSEEFMCFCGCGEDNISPEFVQMLERVRVTYGKPITITSGMRCPDHNEAVGGKPNSAHVLGYAADIACSNSGDRFRLLDAILVSFERIGVGKNFIHVDCDSSKPSPVMWVY